MRALSVLLLIALPGSWCGHHWEVRDAGDWRIESNVLQLATPRGPLPGPRRPIQFALADASPGPNFTIEVDVKPLGRSLMIVYAYRDEAHFDYAHLSTDRATKESHHNGIFHVYGGERVRISPEDGPSAFAENNRWYHVKLTHDGSGLVRVFVDGKAIPALEAVDRSLLTGRVGLGSFDETAEFRNFTIQ